MVERVRFYECKSCVEKCKPKASGDLDLSQCENLCFGNVTGIE